MFIGFINLTICFYAIRDHQKTITFTSVYLLPLLVSLEETTPKCTPRHQPHRAISTFYFDYKEASKAIDYVMNHTIYEFMKIYNMYITLKCTI